MQSRGISSFRRTRVNDEREVNQIVIIIFLFLADEAVKKNQKSEDKYKLKHTYLLVLLTTYCFSGADLPEKALFEMRRVLIIIYLFFFFISL